MSYEFYIMSGIAVFVGCTWLYRKGKGAYMMVRKIRSAFKVVNINPASSLADEQYKKLAVGALYASQQGVYQNSIKTGIDYELPQILGEWWGIKNSQDAREKMDYLLEKDSDIISLMCGRLFFFPTPSNRMRCFSNIWSRRKIMIRLYLSFRIWKRLMMNCLKIK